MSEHLTFLALGLGSGAVIALLALGVLVTYRASGVINFAHAALGMYIGFAYYEFRQSGDLVLPILGLPDRVRIVDRPTVVTALVVCLILAAAVGAIVYMLIFRPLRSAPPLARVVASLGLMAYLIGIVGLRFEGAAATSLRLDGPLPSELRTLLGVQAPANRWILALIAVAIATGLWAMYRFTAFGLATRASAESEEGALLLGLAPTPIGLVNWMLAVVIAGVAIIAAAPVTGLDPAGTSLLIVPALGAALLGRFEAVWITLFAGLGIGMLQSELFNVQSQGDWLPNIGIQQGVPFLVVLIALVWRGSTLPGRDALSVGRLPPAVAPTHTIAVTAAVAVAGVVALVVLDSEWRLAIIISGIATIIALSIVVLTGLVGQMSLATFALAGTAAFAMIRSAESLGLPFPFAPIAGIIAAVGIGTLAGLPAFRVRGLTLAVATLAASIAIEELLFKWSWFTGGATGAEVPEPSLFGIDLGISAVGDEYPQRSFGVLVLVCMFASMVDRREPPSTQHGSALAGGARQRARRRGGRGVRGASQTHGQCPRQCAGRAGRRADRVRAASHLRVVVRRAPIALRHGHRLPRRHRHTGRGAARRGARRRRSADHRPRHDQRGFVEVPVHGQRALADRRRRAVPGRDLRCGAIARPTRAHRFGGRSTGRVRAHPRTGGGPGMNLDEIVDGAMGIIDDQGADALSMRGLARELGVSAPALYEHLDSRDQLLRILAQQGYDDLHSRWGVISGSALEWLLETGRAYVDFAVERPELFMLMHRFSPGAILGDPDIEHPAASALFDEGLDHIAAAIEAGDLRNDEPLDIAVALWAAAHGVAMVAIMTPGLADATDLATRVVGGLLEGLRPTPGLAS